MSKLFKHYKIFKDDKQSGFSTYSHIYEGDTWGKITQTSESVVNGINFEDGYTEQYEIILRNYKVSSGDVLECEGKEYRVESAFINRNKTIVKAVLEWHVA